jgi:hypothetical protein
MRGSPEDLSVIIPVKVVCWENANVKMKKRREKILFIFGYFFSYKKWGQSENHPHLYERYTCEVSESSVFIRQMSNQI